MALTRADLLQATLRAITTHEPVSSQDSSALGWTADREFLEYNAGVIATAENSSRPIYTKVNDGWAVVAYMINVPSSGFGGDWCGMAVLSTVEEYAELTNTNNPQSSGTYQYLGMTWYGYKNMQNAEYGGATSLITSYPVVDMAGITPGINDPLTQLQVERLLNAANVRISGQRDAYTRPVYAVPRIVPQGG